MNIQLPTGNTITISVYEFFFLLDDKDVDLFYQSCIADDMGDYIDNPFSNSASGKVRVEEEIHEEE